VIQAAQPVSTGSSELIGIAAAIVVLLIVFGTFVAAGLPIILALISLLPIFVLLAALMNSLRVVEKRAADIRVVVVGAGAAGSACAEIMLAHGVGEIIVCDLEGALYPGRPALDPRRMALAAATNPRNERGMANDLLAGADVLVRRIRARRRVRGCRAHDGCEADRLRDGKPCARGTRLRR